MERNNIWQMLGQVDRAKVPEIKTSIPREMDPKHLIEAGMSLEDQGIESDIGRTRTKKKWLEEETKVWNRLADKYLKENDPEARYAIEQRNRRQDELDMMKRNQAHFINNTELPMSRSNYLNQANVLKSGE